MPLYRYYKGPEKKGRWRVVDVENESVRLDDEDTAFATVLAVNEKVTSSNESISESAEYSGPFYIDLDSDSLAHAIRAAKTVYKKLVVTNKVPSSAIEIYASGKRGFHFVIPMGVFTKNVFVARLPIIYRHMAMLLKLPQNETDMTVYSEGRGRMWRLVNKKRVDNGMYKVQVTASELLNMTVPDYHALVSAPREQLYTAEVKPNSVLQALYVLAETRMRAMQKPKSVFIDPEMKDALDGELPPCAAQLLHNKDIRPGKGFNDVSVQFAKAVVAFDPENSRELIAEFAEHASGESYNSPKKRQTHCQTAVRIASKNTSYQWSCKSALSVLSNEPCNTCPIAFVRVQQEDADLNGSAHPMEEVISGASDIAVQKRVKAPEPASVVASVAGNGAAHHPTGIDRPVERVVETQAEDEAAPEPATLNTEIKRDEDDNLEGLMTSADGYGFMTGEGAFRRISNFTLDIKKYYMEFIPALEEDRRVAVMADVLITGKKVGRVMFEEGNWFTKSALIGCLSGLKNTAFYGKDDDVQKMKSTLMQDIEQRAEQVRRVRSCGIHRTTIGEQDIFTYVEPGWSVDQFGNVDKFFLAGKADGPFPKLKSVPYPVAGDKAITDLLNALLNINNDVTVAQVTGWYMAAILKQHFLATRSEFPLLSIYGNRGSGKSSTTAVFAALHGCDYLMESSPVSMSNVTPFVLWRTISTSNTIPRIMEEYNKSSVQKYGEFGEYFKDCWNGYAVKRGSLAANKGYGTDGMGASTVDFPLTAPVVVCSEQGIMMPALVQRMVQVEMSTEYFANIPAARANFDYVRKRVHKFYPLSKLFYMEALGVPVAQVGEWMDKYLDKVPLDMGDRPHYSYRVVLTGLEFLKMICEKHGYAVVERIDELINALVAVLNDDRLSLVATKQRTEIDIFLNKIAAMAAVSEQDGMLSWIVHNVHYMKTETHLILDGFTAHAQYKRYMAQVERAPCVIDDINQLLPLIKTEAYCESINEVVEGFARERRVIKLNLALMARKGIEIGAFKDS